MAKTPKTAAVLQRAGWGVKEWCASAAISDALFYKLEPDLRPTSIKVLGKRVVTEKPADWLARIGAHTAGTGRQK